MINFLQKNKSLIPKLLFVSILLGMFSIYARTAIAATTMMDINTSSDYAKQSIQALVEKNIISGDDKGFFHPLRTVKRSEMVKMIVRALDIDTSHLPEVPTFTDVPRNHWAYEFVEAGVRKGIVKGIAPGEFGIDRECTREEMATLFVRSLGLTDEVMAGQQPYLYLSDMKDANKISPWAKEYVEFALTTGLMNGIGSDTFGAKASAQRQQVAVVTDRFINNKQSVNQFAKSFSGDMPYSELHKALVENSRHYKGNVDTHLQMSIKGDAEKDMGEININMGMIGLLDADTDTNLLNFDMTYNTSLDMMEGFPPFEDQYRVIKLGDSYYFKYSDSDTWMKMSPSELYELGMTSSSSSGKSVELLKYYRYSSISKEENISFRGSPVTKYTFSFDKKAMQALMSDLMDDQINESDESMPTQIGMVSGNFEVYVNNQNQLAGERINLTGNVWDEEFQEEVSTTILLDVYFDNIGQNVIIQAPVI